MICPYCQKEIKDEAKFCSYCGRMIQNQNMNTHDLTSNTEVSEKPRKKKPRAVMILIPVLCAVVLMSGVGAYFLARSSYPWFKLEGKGILSYNESTWKFFYGKDSTKLPLLPRKYDGLIDSVRDDSTSVFRRGVEYDGTLKDFVRYNPWFFSLPQYSRYYEDDDGNVHGVYCVYCSDYKLTFTTFLLNENDPGEEEMKASEAIITLPMFDSLGEPIYYYEWVYGVSIWVTPRDQKDGATLPFQTLELFNKWLAEGVYYYYSTDDYRGGHYDKLESIPAEYVK